jgi:hypothetical protein
MAIDIIPAKTPIIIPAIPERVCNVVVVPSLNLQYEISDGAMKLRLTAEAYQAAFDQHGVALSPAPIARIIQPDMFALAENDPLAENLMNAVVAFYRDQLIQQGVLDEQQGSEGTPQE